MGSLVENNDTLEITVAQGFPSDIFDLSKHLVTPVTIEEVGDRLFNFHDKPDRHIYQFDPVRVFLLQNINDRWLFWGKAYIQSQTISKTFGSDGLGPGRLPERTKLSKCMSRTTKGSLLFENQYQGLATFRNCLWQPLQRSAD